MLNSVRCAFIFLLSFAAFSTNAETSAAPDIAKLTSEAEGGDIQAQMQLADIYYSGTENQAIQLEKAAYWYQKLAENEFAQAQLALALMYIKGEGVEKNDKEGVRWLTRAADQKLASAQYLLGIAYENGHGIEVDMNQAYMWYEVAAALQHPNSVEARDRLATQLSKSDVDKAEKLANEWWLKHHH